MTRKRLLTSTVGAREVRDRTGSERAASWRLETVRAQMDFLKRSARGRLTVHTGVRQDRNAEQGGGNPGAEPSRPSSHTNSATPDERFRPA